MSRYFQTLKRLQSGRSVPNRAAQVVDLVKEAPTADFHTFPRVTLQSARVQTAFSELLERLRLASLSAPSRSLVIASISDAQASHHVMAGLRVVAEKKGLQLVTGELAFSRGDRLVKLHRAGFGSGRDEAAKAASGEISVPLHFDDASLPDTLRAQIEKLDAKAEAAILHGPPLARSVEAALLAAATAGLVLIVEPLVTPRSDLIVALDRAEHSGSVVLGIVTLGEGAALPQWLLRSLDGATA